MGFWREKVRPLLLEQLRRGTSPEKLAQTLSIGISVSCCPIFGSTTFLAGAVGAALSLNHALLQIVNYAAMPLQLLLILPYCRLGRALFAPDAPALPDLAALAKMAPMFAIKAGGMALLRGTAAWAVTAPAGAWLLYMTFLPLLRRIKKKK